MLCRELSTKYDSSENVSKRFWCNSVPKHFKPFVMASARYNISKRGIPKTPKLATLGVIDEDDHFDEITDITDDDEEEEAEE